MSEQATLVDKIGHFTTIPNSVIRMIPQIGPDAFTLWSYLRYMTNRETETAFPSYDRIEKDTGLTRRRIASAIKVLEAAGLLARQRRFSASTIYTLQLPPVATRTISNNGALMEEMEQSPLVQGVNYISATGALPLVQQVHANKTDLTKTEVGETESSSAAPASPSRKQARARKPPDIAPELVRYRTMTGYLPDKTKYDYDRIIRIMSSRPPEELDRYYQAWLDKHYRRDNPGWLDWVEAGRIPNNGCNGRPGVMVGAGVVDSTHDMDDAWVTAENMRLNPHKQDFFLNVLPESERPRALKILAAMEASHAVAG